MRFLIDMNLSPGWVHFLAKEHIEAIHWSYVGAGTASDEDVMRWADEHDYVVLTADLDFGAILAATGRRKPSVIQIRSDLIGPEAIGGILLTCIRTVEEPLSNGALISLEAARARVRILPLP
jgi:predicted nuclease of predicted toxin-antitoxin system